MARRGRKRKHAAERHACGKVVQTPARERADDVRRTGTWNRAREALARGLADPRWGSELGRLHYQGRIVETQREAGERLAEIIADHRRLGLAVGNETVKLPSDQPKVSKFERVSPGEPVSYDVEIVRRAQMRFDKLFAGVLDMGGIRGRDGVAVWRAVTKLCVESEPLTYEEELLAKRGLDRIALLLGLTGVRRFPKNRLEKS